jgi:aldose 1-epimerase
VKTLNIGATLFEVFHKKKKINLILNLGKISSYNKNKNYLGATCGRYANRIKNAQFKIKGVNYKLSKNEGKNILHGGKKGFDSKIWHIKNSSKSHITYYYISPDKEEGFPGELYTTCSYSLDKYTLKINMNARTSYTTHVNLVNHAYWNLEKIKKNIFNHCVRINANNYLENDKENIPTGKIIKVDGTHFDFRKLRRIGESISNKTNGFDENFIIKNNSRFVAKIYSPKSKIELKIFSNQPGVQFYTGQHLRYVNQNKRINKYQGMCFETQGFPNAPNNIKFPSTLLNPSQTYKHNIRFVIGTKK